MWGDDGAPQMKYGTILTGMGFGNKGAAWNNYTVNNWLDSVTP